MLGVKVGTEYWEFPSQEAFDQLQLDRSNGKFVPLASYGATRTVGLADLLAEEARIRSETLKVARKNAIAMIWSDVLKPARKQKPKPKPRRDGP